MSATEGREFKKEHTFKLSDGTMRTIEAIQKDDGCSQSEIIAVAIACYQQSRMTLDLLLHYNHVFIADSVLEKETGVYQQTVNKCHKFMASSDRDNRRRKGELVKLLAACEIHLDQDLITPEEREEFTRYVIWTKNKLQEL